MTDRTDGSTPSGADSAAASAASDPAPATASELAFDQPVPDAVAAMSGEAPQSRTFWANINQPFGLGFLVVLGGLLAWVLGSAIANLSAVLIYIVFALFIALGLEPLVKWLEGHNLKRGWAIVTVILAFALVITGVLVLIIPTVVQQIAQFVRDLPSLIVDFSRSDLYKWIVNTFGADATAMLDQAQSFLTNPANIASIGGGVLQVGVSIATGISGTIIVFVLTLYFLASLEGMKQWFVRLAPARNRTQVRTMTDQITVSVGGYLGGMVTLAFMNATFAGILYTFLGLPFPLLMAVVAFCITLIPLIGSVLFWAIGTSLALFTGWLPALLFAAIYMVYMQLEAYFLTPRVMNKAISVPGALVVIGALVGGTLMGLLGALVAIPVTASIILIIKQVIIPRQDAKV